MNKPIPCVLNGIFTGFPALKKTILLLFLALIAINCPAQQKPNNYSLLWKISGKGLTKPSFIFGTMHVKDKRVFGFSDSVMLAIQSCPSFALEVHPDTLIKQMFIDRADDDSSRNLHKLLSKEEYDELAKRFEAKNGYPLGNIDPIQAESMMQAVKEKPDDKKAFVDAYLFGVARGLGKNIYGLENTLDQLKDYGDSSKIKIRLQDILETSDDEAYEETEEMIKVYSTGDLKQIFEYLGEDRLEDSILIVRNKVMVKSILMRMATDPIFAAVGVAHLTGQNGLISLLRNAGYTVTPVTANFTGVANKFNTDYTKLKWMTYTDEQQGYSIDFPFAPIQTGMIDGVRAIVYPDMANDMFFGTYAVLSGIGSKPGAADAAINRVIKNIKDKKQSILSNKIIYANGLKITELITRDKKQTLRYRFLVSNNYLYCIYAGNDFTSLTQPYANRFFDSFKSFKPAIKPDKKWINYNNDTAAFSVDLPMQPVLVRKIISVPNRPDATYDLNMYVATDSVKLINYLVRYNDYPKGMYLAYKTKAFDALEEELKSKGMKNITTKTIFKDGYEGREITFEAAAYPCKAQFFIRGNRTYMLLKQNLRVGSDINNGFDFFKTFKFKPYLNPTLTQYAVNENFKGAIFEKLNVTTDTVNTYNSFLRASKAIFSTNPASAGLFGFEHSKISEYYRAANVDSMYKTLQKQLVTYQDTLLKNDTITVNGVRGREYVVQNTNSKTKERTRVFVDNGNVIYFVSHVADEELFTEASNKFYNSLVKTSSTPAISLASSKAQLITNDLLSKDTTTYNYALGAFSYYKFDKDELSYLLSAVQKTHADDTTQNGARVKLVEAIAELKDPKSIDVLVSVFNATNSDRLRVSVLSNVTDIDKKTGYDTYLRLLISRPVLNTDASYQIFRPMYDSLEYVAANYTKILPLIKHPEYRRSILSISGSLLKQKYKNKYLPLVTEHFNELTQYATEDLNKYLADTSDNKWSHGIYSYLQLMNKVKDQPLTEGFTSTLIKKDGKGGEISDAVIARIHNNLKISPQLTNQMLDSIDLTYDVLEALNKNGRLASAPIKYRTQQAFAKASLYKYLVDMDDGSPANLRLLGIIPEKGNQYYVFKFDSADDSDTHYTGVCGPYKTGSTKLDFSIYRAYTDWDEKKQDWKLHAKKMITKLKETNKEDLKNIQE